MELNVGAWGPKRKRVARGTKTAPRKHTWPMSKQFTCSIFLHTASIILHCDWIILHHSITIWWLLTSCKEIIHVGSPNKQRRISHRRKASQETQPGSGSAQVRAMTHAGAWWSCLLEPFLFKSPLCYFWKDLFIHSLAGGVKLRERERGWACFLGSSIAP